VRTEKENQIEVKSGFRYHEMKPVFAMPCAQVVGTKNVFVNIFQLIEYFSI